MREHRRHFLDAAIIAVADAKTTSSSPAIFRKIIYTLLVITRWLNIHFVDFVVNFDLGVDGT